MAKQAIFYEEAKRLFVQEGLSIEIIYERLGQKVARRTLSKWKADGNWDEKRKEFAKINDDLNAGLVEVANLPLQGKAKPFPSKYVCYG
jgi:uncharacterized protein YjcR